MTAHIIALLFLFTCAASHGEDLGARGQTYQIDPDARNQIKGILQKKQASGEIDRYWRDYQAKNIAAIKNPKPLGIASSYTARVETFDPTFTLPSDIRGAKGELVAKKGTVIKPLQIQPLAYALLFIDGRDQRQVDYAVAKSHQAPTKIVLTAGSPYLLRKRYQNETWQGSKTLPFYFDQKKMILTQLEQLYHINIQTVPALLTQNGTRLQAQFGIPS